MPKFTETSGIVSLGQFTADTAYTSSVAIGRATKWDVVKINATHTHTSVGSGNAHNHGNTGGSGALTSNTSSNLPPYITCYMWKRTA